MSVSDSLLLVYVKVITWHLTSSMSTRPPGGIAFGGRSSRSGGERLHAPEGEFHAGAWAPTREREYKWRSRRFVQNHGRSRVGTSFEEFEIVEKLRDLFAFYGRHVVCSYESAGTVRLEHCEIARRRRALRRVFRALRSICQLLRFLRDSSVFVSQEILETSRHVACD